MTTTSDGLRTVKGMQFILRRHALHVFFALAYGLSWGSLLILSAPTFFPFGPVLAACAVAFAGSGTVGLATWLRHIFRWRAAIRWYAWALVIPAIITMISGSFVSEPVRTPAPAFFEPRLWLQLPLLLPLALVDAPLWEEAGWRGFAIQRFSPRHKPLAVSVLLGLLLAGWHLPIALENQAISAPYLIATFASAIVTNWLYFGSGECVLVAIAFHTSQNATMGLLVLRERPGNELVMLWWIIAGVYCLAAICLAHIKLFSKPWQRSRTALPGAS